MAVNHNHSSDYGIMVQFVLRSSVHARPLSVWNHKIISQICYRFSISHFQVFPNYTLLGCINLCLQYITYQI